MPLKTAYKILKSHNIVYYDYFDLMRHRSFNHMVNMAIERVQTFLTIGY